MSKCHIVGNHLSWLIFSITPSYSIHDGFLSFGPRREKTCLREFANNTGADQPAHPRSLISTFVIRFMESIICKLATDENSSFYLVSVGEETDLKLALTETPKTGFLSTRPILPALIFIFIKIF